MATTAATKTAIHARIVRHGWRALAVASGLGREPHAASAVCDEPFGLVGERLGRRPLPRDQQREHGSDADDDRADPERRHETVREGGRRLVPSAAREDRGEHGDSEHASDLPNRVVCTGRLALLLGPNRREDDVRHRREEERHADTGEYEGSHERDVADRRRGDVGDPAQSDRLQREPQRHQRTSADPVGQRTRDRCHEHRHDRPGEDTEPGLERRVPLRGLEELRQQEDRAEHPEVHEQGRSVGRGERPVAEEPHGQHRLRRAELPGDERCEQCCSRHEGADDRRARPAVPVAVDDPPDQPEHAAAREREAREVECLVGPGRLTKLRRQRQEDQPDRHVQPEDPLPGDAVDDGAADERAHGDSEAGDAGPGAERDTAPLARDRSAQDRQGQRRHDRGAEALQRSSGDQPVGRRSERRGGRGSGEDPDPDHEHALAPEAVAERRSGEQEHRERERVGVHGPLELLDRGAEIDADHRNRRRDDEVVEHDHEERDRGDHERPDRASAGFHRVLLPVSSW